MNKADLILEQREQRAILQNSLLNNNKTLVVIKANYPGADKRNVYSNYLVFKTYILLSKIFDVVNYQATNTLEGLIIFLSINEDVVLAKKKCIEIEDSEVYRLVDIDVFYKNRQLSRNDFKFKRRKCYLCDNDAIICVRSQNHLVNDIKSYFESRVIEDIFSKNIWYNLCVFGMINELCKELSCGTVIIQHNGSHNDMDYKTFFASTIAIANGFRRFDNVDTTSFEQLRCFGVELELEMFNATNGVNTHKGAIFILIIVFASIKNSDKYIEIPSEIKRLTKDIFLDFENKKICKTFTTDLYLKKGISGIRGYAKDGFNSVFENFEPFYSINEDLNSLFLLIISEIEDTTVIKRAGFQNYLYLKSLAFNTINNKDKYKFLEEYCLNNNISCGGSADILCVVLIVNLIKRYYLKFNC